LQIAHQALVLSILHPDTLLVGFLLLNYCNKYFGFGNIVFSFRDVQLTLTSVSIFSLALTVSGSGTPPTLMSECEGKPLAHAHECSYEREGSHKTYQIIV
jgi:hypothetical protein